MVSNAVVTQLRIPRGRAAIGLVLLATVAVSIFWAAVALQPATPPEQVVRQYVSATYARDYAVVYDLLSDADRDMKSREAYLRENDSFAGFALQLAYRLASYIEFRPLSTASNGHASTVLMKMRLPDGNAPAVQEILKAAEREPNLSPAQRQELMDHLEQLYTSGQVPMLDVEQEFQLVTAGDGWRVSLGASGIVRVRFSGAVNYGLPWEFAPVQAEVLARRGETLQAFYRVKNLADREIVAKGVHRFEPKEYRQYFETILCFCFIQQRLKPGEEQLMKLVFRIAPDAPETLDEFRIHYDFYPFELAPSF